MRTIEDLQAVCRSTNPDAVCSVGLFDEAIAIAIHWRNRARDLEESFETTKAGDATAEWDVRAGRIRGEIHHLTELAGNPALKVRTRRVLEAMIRTLEWALKDPPATDRLEPVALDLVGNEP